MADYKPINADVDAVKQEQKRLEQVYAQNPNTNAAYTNDQLEQQLKEAGVDTSNLYTWSQLGGYTQNKAEAIAGGGTGETVQGYKDNSYYYAPGIDRPVAEGNSGADEHHLSDAEYNYIQYCQQMYEQAKAAGNTAEMEKWHSEAEKTRARYGYSGGSDGSGYYTLGSLGVTDSNANAPTNGTSSTAGGSSDLKSLLDAWQEAALKQSDGKIDYAVAKAVADLERALEDAQPQYKEQAESVDLNARQAMDNSALYAELRGDKGGIGQEQYNAIQNTQAQNHLAVQQAQTKLATDTQRQIADLRAQGEFEKADAALEITQTYLAQLISIEQWAAEYNLSVEQFNEAVRQWEAEYNMAMQQLQISQNQWQQEFDFANQQYQDSLNQWEREFALEQYLAQLKSNVGSDGTDWAKLSDSEIYQNLYDLGYTNRSEASISAFLQSQGMSSSLANKYAEAYATEQYRNIQSSSQPTATDRPSAQSFNDLKGHINAWPKRGITASEIAYMIENAYQNGDLTEEQASELIDLMDEKRMG